MQQAQVFITPEGSGDDGYPFLLVYDKSTLAVQSFQYFDLSYAGVDPSHGTGLRVQYSGEEEAFYICGVLADRKFNEINPNDIDVKSKGFILKVPESGALSYDALIFTPDQVQNDAWLCGISDIEINATETEIAFTGLNTLDELTNYHHSMSGVVDMDLTLDWCKVYEVTNVTYAGIDIEYDDDDNTLLVLQNSTTTEFSILELNESNGNVLQGPETWKFTDLSTSNDTTRAMKMHYYNDTLIITGNHFAEVSSTEYEHLFRFDVKADTLDKSFGDFTYYYKQETPDGNQKTVYSFWTPENSVYYDDTLHLVGVLDDYYWGTDQLGFTYVRADGIDDECIWTFSKEANTRTPDDVVSYEPGSTTCSDTDINDTDDDITVSDSLDCEPDDSYLMGLNTSQTNEEIWQLVKFDENGIEATLISDKPASYLVSVYDILGREVYRSKFNAGKGETSINMNFELKPEVYIITVSDGKESKTRKVVNLN